MLDFLTVFEEAGKWLFITSALPSLFPSLCKRCNPVTLVLGMCIHCEHHIAQGSCNYVDYSLQQETRPVGIEYKIESQHQSINSI